MNIRFSTLPLIAASSLALLPSASLAQSRDTWRAASVASAAVAVYGLSKHDAGLTILGAAGAILSASQADRRHGRRDCYEPRYRHESHVVIVEPRHREDWNRRNDDRWGGLPEWNRTDRGRRDWDRDRDHRGWDRRDSDRSHRDRDDRGRDRRAHPFGR